MKKFLLNLFFLLQILIIPYKTLALIDSTYSINSKTSNKLKDWLQPGDVVIINIDDTIVTPESKMFSYYNNPYNNFINNLAHIGHNNSNKKYYNAIAKWYSKRKIKLVENRWDNFINELKEKGIKVFGICSMPIKLSNIEKKRYYELAQLGIYFTPKINLQDYFIIDKMSDWNSIFYKGIIFTGPYRKAQTILKLMENENLIPKKMLVITTIESEVKEINRALRIFNNKYYVLEYLAIFNSKQQPDEKVVKLQQQQLINKGIWLEDEEAEKIINAPYQK